MTANILKLIENVDDSKASSIVVVGSFARAQALKHSDLDILRLYRKPNKPEKNSFILRQGRMLSISNISEEQTKLWFSKPDIAVDILLGIKNAKIIRDEDSYFANIQNKAVDFIWDDKTQQKANVWASQALVGWIEEVNKGLNGLKTNDTGRLLQAGYGLSWGLSKVVQVARGIFISSDNGSYDEINEAMKTQASWLKLREKAFGIDCNLREAVTAGLLLYVETVNLLEPNLSSKDRATINHSKNTILAYFKTQ